MYIHFLYLFYLCIRLFFIIWYNFHLYNLLNNYAFLFVFFLYIPLYMCFHSLYVFSLFVGVSTSHIYFHFIYFSPCMFLTCICLYSMMSPLCISSIYYFRISTSYIYLHSIYSLSIYIPILYLSLFHIGPLYVYLYFICVLFPYKFYIFFLYMFSPYV